MAAGFIRERKQEEPERVSKVGVTLFYNLISDGISYHFCHILPIRCK